MVAASRLCFREAYPENYREYNKAQVHNRSGRSGILDCLFILRVICFQ